MPRTTAPGTRPGVSFEVERLDLQDDELVITGHWAGIRGLRFVRPTLVMGDRQVHATLEHKPWAPTVGEPWTAAFPWKQGAAVDVSTLELAVAPSVLVSLAGDAGEPAVEARAAVDLEEMAQAERHADMDAMDERDELIRARSAAERERDRAIEQRDEAVRDLAAAVRTRARMEAQHDQAIGLREAAEGQLETAFAERDKMRAQRDEALVASRGLQRRLQSERAEADRLQTEPLPATEHHETRSLPPTADARPGIDDDPEEPIGVRTIPAARTMLAELQRPEPARKFVVSKFDLWAIRVLGSVAAACFILLLVMILRVFI